jgi:hypothetical protein
MVVPHFISPPRTSEQELKSTYLADGDTIHVISPPRNSEQELKSTFPAHGLAVNIKRPLVLVRFNQNWFTAYSSRFVSTGQTLKSQGSIRAPKSMSSNYWVDLNFGSVQTEYVSLPLSNDHSDRGCPNFVGTTL